MTPDLEQERAKMAAREDAALLGVFLEHEALHTAWIAEHFAAYHLCEHRAIRKNKRWKKQAKKAHRALFDLYQMIGADTIMTPAPEPVDAKESAHT